MKPLRRLASLQARLLLLLLGLVTGVWLAAALLTWNDARHELDELLDGHLAQAAALLVVQQSKAPDDEDVADAPSLHRYAPKVAFQVFHEGRLVMRSANAGVTAMASTSHGFLTVRLADGNTWRVFATRGAERDVQVYVGEQTASRATILRAVLRGMLLPLAFALPLLALAGWWAVRQGLAPLRQLSQLLAQRQPQALTPVALADPPTEMQPLLQALNKLLARMEHMLATERRFTADAAHELRTPIAAIRAQAQVAIGAGDDDAQREQALRNTLTGCDRATHLVEQLLTLARLEAATDDAAAATARPDLSALARRVAAELAPTALARAQELELDTPGVCSVSGDEALLEVLLRNLIDNALRYSPSGAQIRVSVAQEAGQVLLRVEDSGPGLTEQQMTRLGERFYRVLGSGQSGSGLGWSIVRRIGRVFGLRIECSRSQQLGGLAVVVCWPAPDRRYD